MKKTAQTLVEIVIITGITVILLMVAAYVMSENIRGVFSKSNFTNLMHREDTKFKNPNSHVEGLFLNKPDENTAEDL